MIARRLLSVLLALVLLASAVAAGAARGQARADGQVVICSGAGTVVLWLDAEGRPVPHPVTCPDCVLTALAAVWPGPALPEGPQRLRPAAPLAAAGLAERTARRVGPPARGPPARA